MKIAIVGAGGVGGYFGARLAAGGQDVTFIARGAHLAAMRDKGLRVLSALGDLTLQPVQALEDPQQLGHVDMVMLAVKLWSTQEAAEAIAPLMGPRSSVVSWQNGVMAEDILISRYGRERVIGGVSNIAALIEAPGVIRHNGNMARLIFGELDGSASSRVEALAAACKQAGVECVVSPDITCAIWQKFAWLTAMSGMTSLTRMPIGPIREDAELRAMLRSAIEEAVAVGSAKGVKLPEDQVDQAMKWGDTLPYTMVASMLGDLQRGNRLELAWLSGAVAQLGAELGVPTPVQRFISLGLKLHAAGAPRGQA